MHDVYEKARRFMYRNARPVDLARWQYHFENGSREAVLTALACYQNEDGGFGHALEADAWNPHSTPIQTWTATEILREVGCTDPAHPIIQGILRYLGSGADFNGHFWANTVLSNNDYPHAPWWHTESISTCHTNYNPTACLAGFVIRFADRDSGLYRLGCQIAREAFETVMAAVGNQDMHTVSCYIRLMEYCQEAEVTAGLDLETLRGKLAELVHNGITQDRAAWKTGYICKPSQFMRSKDSVFYPDNWEIAEYECDFIENTQREDGAWSINWSWQDYPNEWAISRNWWKGTVVVQNLLYLKGYGRL